MRDGGHRSPLASNAERVLCSASLTDLAGRPTIVKRGTPVPTSTSTSIGRASVPTSATDSIFASNDPSHPGPRERDVARVGKGYDEKGPVRFAARRRMSGLLQPQLPGEHMAIALVAVTLGGLVQGSIGFGFALVSVPTLALIRPDALPATLLFMALPLTAFMAVRERGSIDVRGWRHAIAGRLLGTAAGVGLVAGLPTDSLSVVIGIVILVAVAMSLLSPTIAVQRATSLGAGFASGVMGTAAAVGGPPLALLYQGRSGPELRSTLAALFVVGPSSRSPGWPSRARSRAATSSSPSSSSPAWRSDWPRARAR